MAALVTGLAELAGLYYAGKETYKYLEEDIHSVAKAMPKWMKQPLKKVFSEKRLQRDYEVEMNEGNWALPQRKYLGTGQVRKALPAPQTHARAEAAKARHALAKAKKHVERAKAMRGKAINTKSYTSYRRRAPGMFKYRPRKKLHKRRKYKSRRYRR